MKLQDCSSQTTIVDLFSKKSKETLSNDVVSLCESLEKSGLNESNSIQIKCKACDDESVAKWSCKECKENICDLCYKALIYKLTKHRMLSELNSKN